jgi:Holliday junction resolvase-like predicted endonuclease
VTKKEKGNKGEQRVVQHLQDNGFTIVKRNFFWCKHEIDIIASKNGKVYLVEVKTSSMDFLKISQKQKMAYETFILKYYSNQFVHVYVAIVNDQNIQLVLMDT